MKATTTPEKPAPAAATPKSDRPKITAMRKSLQKLAEIEEQLVELPKQHEQARNELDDLVDASSLQDPAELKLIEAKKTQVGLLEMRFKKAKLEKEDMESAFRPELKAATGEALTIIAATQGRIASEMKGFFRQFLPEHEAHVAAHACHDFIAVYRMYVQVHGLSGWVLSHGATLLLKHLSAHDEFVKAWKPPVAR